MDYAVETGTLFGDDIVDHLIKNTQMGQSDMQKTLMGLVNGVCDWLPVKVSTNSGVQLLALYMVSRVHADDQLWYTDGHTGEQKHVCILWDRYSHICMYVFIYKYIHHSVLVLSPYT